MGCEEHRGGARFKTLTLLFISSVAGDAVELVDKHLTTGNLRGGCVMRKTVEAGHHGLRYYPERQEASDYDRWTSQDCAERASSRSFIHGPM